MFLANETPFTARCLEVPGGLAGVHETIRAMRRAVKVGRVSPVIIQAARSIVFLTPEKDDLAEISALFEFVRDSIRYVRDVHEIETLSSAEKTLATRAGDCDDQTVLLAALFEAVGYPTRFVLTGYADPEILEHVHLQVRFGEGWMDCDPTERNSLGWFPPDAIVEMVEKTE